MDILQISSTPLLKLVLDSVILNLEQMTKQYDTPKSTFELQKLYVDITSLVTLADHISDILKQDTSNTT